MQGTINVAKRCEHHPVTVALLKQKIRLELDGDAQCVCDYRCTSVGVVMEPYAALDDVRGRVYVKDRILAAKAALGGRQLALVVIMTTTDPSLDVLNWLNVECGIQLQVAVVLCWSTDEAAVFLQHARTSSALSLDYAGGGQKKEAAPLPALIDAFTQSPQILTRPDIVRIANRHRTVAEMLCSTPDSFDGVPGMGKRKVDRLHSLLNTPFTASTERVTDVLQGAEKHQEAERTGIAVGVTTPGAQTTMQDALRRRQEAEDDSGDDVN